MRMIYELHCLKNPQHTLGLAAGEPVHIVPISKTVAAARRIVFGGICKKLALSKWFQGKYIETMEEVRFKKKGIYIVGGASQDAAALGLNAICLAGDTLIQGVRGPVRLDALPRKCEVLSFDSRIEKPVWEQATSPRLTKRQADVVRLSLSNGRFVRCTPDHRFLRESGVYGCAGSFSPGDVLRGITGTVEVVSVEPDGVADVYDLTVSRTENFALTAGVFAHNCAVVDESNFLGSGKVTTGSASGQAEDKATMIYNALARRVKSRFRRHGITGLVLLVSSKRSTEDFTERRIRRGVAENDPGLFVRDYCLTGDTKVPLLDGTTRTMRELAETKEPFWVYSVDPKTHRYVPGRGHSARLTAKQERILEVELDNGKVVRATPWHPFMLRDGTYRRADELKAGDSLMPLYRRDNGRSYEEVKHPSNGRWETTYKMRDNRPTFSSLKKAAGHFSPGGGKKRVPGNHKVFNVRDGGRADVYDLTVDDYHNFALDAGVVVHNSTWHVHPEAFKESKWHKVLVSPKLGRTRLLEDGEDDDESIKKFKIDDPDSLVFEFPEEYYQEFYNDTDGSTRDFAGIATDFAGRLYISKRQLITGMMDETWPQWFKSPTWTTNKALVIDWGSVMTTNLRGDPVPRCCPGALRHVHIDLSTTHCATGFAMGHIAGSMEVFRTNPENPLEKTREEAPIIHFDCTLQIDAPQGEEVDHGEVRGLVYRLMDQGVPLRSVSMDQYMAPSNLQMFKRRGLRTAEVGERKHKLKPYLVARTALYEKRVFAPVDDALRKELQSLEIDETSKKIKKPARGTKDLADAWAGTIFYISENMRQGVVLAPSKGESTTSAVNVDGPQWTSGGGVLWGDEDDLSRDDDIPSTGEGYSQWIV